MPDTKVWSEPPNKPQRLHQLGLKEDELLTAVKHGQAAAAMCTENNPPLQRAIVQWGETLRSLRDTKIPQGWKRHDEKNQQPLVLNPKEDMAITAAAGDEYTGIENRNPATKSSKGSLTQMAVKSNRMRNTMFGDIRPETRDTWILLFHRDQETLEIRSELSLPLDMNSEKQVDQWLERIILSPIPFDGIGETLPGDQPKVPEIDIPVKRRA